MTEKKNVLIFAATYLPGVKGGGPIKSIKNIVENLNNEYNFYIVTSDRDLGDSKPYKNIEVNKWIKNENSIVMYVSQDWYSMKNIKRIISEINWDCIYLNSFFGYKFSILPLIVSRNIIKDDNKKNLSEDFISNHIDNSLDNMVLNSNLENQDIIK